LSDLLIEFQRKQYYMDVQHAYAGVLNAIE